MKIQDALDLHLKEEASRIIGEIDAQGAKPIGDLGIPNHGRWFAVVIGEHLVHAQRGRQGHDALHGGAVAYD